MKIQYFKSKGKWFFRIVAANGKTIAQSQSYQRKANCLATVDLFAPLVIAIEQGIR